MESVGDFCDVKLKEFKMRGYDVERKLATYRQACRKGADWLLNFMNQDGSIGPVQDSLYYYRVPWTFALMGEIAAASQVLDWIHRHMLLPEGTFEGVSPGEYSRIVTVPILWLASSLARPCCNDLTSSTDVANTCLPGKTVSREDSTTTGRT